MTSPSKRKPAAGPKVVTSMGARIAADGSGGCGPTTLQGQRLLSNTRAALRATRPVAPAVDEMPGETGRSKNRQTDKDRHSRHAQERSTDGETAAAAS